MAILPLLGEPCWEWKQHWARAKLKNRSCWHPVNLDPAGPDAETYSSTLHFHEPCFPFAGEACQSWFSITCWKIPHWDRLAHKKTSFGQSNPPAPFLSKSSSCTPLSRIWALPETHAILKLHACSMAPFSAYWNPKYCFPTEASSDSSFTITYCLTWLPWYGAYILT